MSDPSLSLSAVELNRLAELAEKLRDNALADAEVAELESMLAGSVAAREAFAALAMLGAELRQTHGRFTCPVPATVQRLGLRASFLRRLWPVAIAAGLVLATIFLWRLAPIRSTAHGEPVVTISNASGAVLLADERVTPTTVGSTLRGGALHLRSGLLELTYPSGVVIVLVSPARFDLPLHLLQCCFPSRYNDDLCASSRQEEGELPADPRGRAAYQHQLPVQVHRAAFSEGLVQKPRCHGQRGARAQHQVVQHQVLRLKFVAVSVSPV